jgi:CDP-diacylglycerol---glycerol-3-phosphate 3-phosphatidyltransferase
MGLGPGGGVLLQQGVRGSKEQGIRDVRVPKLPARLEREWWAWVAAAVILLGTFAWAIAARLPGQGAGWLASAVLVAGYVLAFSRSRLADNHRAGSPDVLPNLGPGTSLTLLRGLLVAPLAGLLLLPPLEAMLAWLPALLYTASAVADHLDGFMARRANHVTPLGEALDLELDGLGVLLAVGLAIHYDRLPLVFLLVGLARYGYLLWAVVLRSLGRTIHELPPSRVRRALAGLEIGFLSAALWPIIPPPLALLTGSVFAVPFLISFSRDALVVGGFLDIASPRYLAMRSAALALATRWIPPLMRIALVVVVGPATWEAMGDLPARSAAFAHTGVANSVVVATVLAAVQGLGLVLTTIGFLGRLGALLLFTALGLTMVALGVTTLSLAGCGLAAGLLMLGPGAASIWGPEGDFVSKRRGGPA